MGESQKDPLPSAGLCFLLPCVPAMGGTLCEQSRGQGATPPRKPQVPGEGCQAMILPVFFFWTLPYLGRRPFLADKEFEVQEEPR